MKSAGHCFISAVKSIAWCFVLFLLARICTESRAHAAPNCSKDKLDQFRSGTFKPLFDKQEFEQAGQGLFHFLESRKCYAQLVFAHLSEAPKEPLAVSTLSDIHSYLRAVRDVALAFQKAGQAMKCLEVVRTDLNREFETTLERVSDKQLRDVFKQIEANCTEQLNQRYPPAALAACPARFDILKVRWHVDVVTEQGGLRQQSFDMPVSGNKGAFQIEQASGFDCIALLSISVPKGSLSHRSKCKSPEACAKSASEQERSTSDLPILAGVKTSPAPEIVELQIEQGPALPRCGDFTLTAHSDGTENTVFRLRGKSLPCAGGAPSGESDQILSLKAGKLVSLESANVFYLSDEYYRKFIN